MLVLCNFFQNIDDFRQNDSHRFRTHTTLKTKPNREIFHFHCLPKLHIGYPQNQTQTHYAQD